MTGPINTLGEDDQKEERDVCFVYMCVERERENCFYWVRDIGCCHSLKKGTPITLQNARCSCPSQRTSGGY